MVLEHILTNSVGKEAEKDFLSKCKKNNMAIQLSDQRRGKLTKGAILRGMDYK